MDSPPKEPKQGNLVNITENYDYTSPLTKFVDLIKESSTKENKFLWDMGEIYFLESNLEVNFTVCPKEFSGIGVECNDENKEKK